MPKSSSPATQTLEQLSSSFDHGVLADGAVKRRLGPGAAAQLVEQRPIADDVQAEAETARRIDDQVDALVGQQPRDDEQALTARART